MKTTAWGYLPNAEHIDAVIASVKSHPLEWGASRLAAWAAAGKAAHTAARNAARNAAWGAVRDAAWLAAGKSAHTASRDAAWDAIAALIAWDHASNYLDITPDLLRVWHALSGDPACVLLLPYAYTRELIAAKEGITA